MAAPYGRSHRDILPKVIAVTIAAGLFTGAIGSVELVTEEVRASHERTLNGGYADHTAPVPRDPREQATEWRSPQPQDVALAVSGRGQE